MPEGNELGDVAIMAIRNENERHMRQFRRMLLFVGGVAILVLLVVIGVSIAAFKEGEKEREIAMATDCYTTLDHRANNGINRGLLEEGGEKRAADKFELLVPERIERLCRDFVSYGESFDDILVRIREGQRDLADEVGRQAQPERRQAP